MGIVMGGISRRLRAFRGGEIPLDWKFIIHKSGIAY
jgi:hypothetical protein